jgi:hypothetical protein
MSEPAGKIRLTVYVPTEIKRRLRIAAAKGDLTLGQYILEAIGSRLDTDVPPDDDLLLAAEGSLEFWDNPADDEAWNER